MKVRIFDVVYVGGSNDSFRKRADFSRKVAKFVTDLSQIEDSVSLDNVTWLQSAVSGVSPDGTPITAVVLTAIVTWENSHSKD